MAETFLSPVIEKLINLLLDEAKSFERVHREVESLKDELELIEPLLRDAERKKERGEMSDTMKVWTRQLREAAIEAENAVDEYRYHAMRRHQRHQQSGFVGSFGRACHAIKTMRPRLVVASKIHHTKDSSHEIRQRAQYHYGLIPHEPCGPSPMDVEGPVDPRLTSLFIEEDELVGIDSMSKELVENLVEGPSARVVISLVGEGGIGKTTLAKRVFDDDAVKRHFQYHVWITVSQQYSLKKVLRKMANAISTRSEDNLTQELDSVEELIDYLRKQLRAKRYVIVFDDVWEDHFWDKVKLALPSNNEGSRLIIRTRSQIISDSCRESTFDLVKNLKSWSLNMAWKLFGKKAFQQFQGKCPEELKELSMEIVAKCQGLPLVISTIASLLARKEEVFEWEKVLGALNSKAEINSQVTRVEEILSLSYYDLPYVLRPCFLYFGIFPEDYSITDERLYRLWIAEGFVKAKRDKTMEEVAAAYLSELVKRNLVAFDGSKPIGEGNWFQVHDLMHNIILSQADESFFCQTWDESTSQFRVKGRRITISSCPPEALKNIESSKIRSLFLSGVDDDQLVTSFVATALRRYKFLEVLDVENSSVDRIPKEIGKFFNLKYLSFRYTEVEVLPKSICELQNLQSLDIRDTLIRELPSEINKLTNLRHLLAYTYEVWSGSFDYVVGVKLPEKFGSLEELQTLTLVEVDVSGGRAIKELEKLKKLRWLDISKLTKENGIALCSAICEMNYLERLSIVAINENEALDLEDLPSPPRFLRELCLVGRLERLPPWIAFHSNLLGLILRESRLGSEALKSLEGLRSLQVLELWFRSYEGEELHFKEGGFLKLKRLALMELDSLKVVKIDEGALPVLENLRIYNCALLEEMPSVQHLMNVVADFSL